MQIGDIIRKYRKEKNITQNEMANRLGVSAPAVNKWENGNSLPDVSLLSPIARLLNISVDTLLSHKQELSDFEANRLVEDAQKRLKTESIDDVFQWMKQCLVEYPNCYFLTLWMARLLDSTILMTKQSDGEKYSTYIEDCYKSVIESDSNDLRVSAAEALYHFYMQREQYEQAEEYLAYFSQENPERKRKQAMICDKTGRIQEAYKMFEELLYAGYHSVNTTFINLYMLALKEDDLNRAHILVEKMQVLAEIFEVGEYHRASAGLELAILKKNEEETLDIVERMVEQIESVYGFAKSQLYSHMKFKKPDESFLAAMKEDILLNLLEDETCAFLRGNRKWIDMTKSNR